ncbi:MAG: putative lipid II flippase FtsW, partial [bacterium]|nr:putative lipid II flippase FtsW [bacterium]
DGTIIMTRRHRIYHRVSRGEPDHLLVALIGLFLIFGLVMLSSASSVVSFKELGSSYALVKHQLFFGVLPGAILFYFVSKVDYHVYRKIAPFLPILIIGLLIAVLIPGVGVVVNGARRWISVAGKISFQPAEFVKLFLVLVLAWWFTLRAEHMRNFKRTVLPFIVFVGIIGGLIMQQPDFGTALIVGLIAAALYFAAGAYWKHLAVLGITVLALAFMLIQIAPYRMERITTFLNPENDPQGSGYHVQQAILAVGSGGWLGLGLGHSRQKFAYLPEVHSDSIFAIIGEELGFVATTVVVILFLLLTFRIIRIARRAPDGFGYLIGIGVASWIGFQAFINMGTMVKLIPLTGLPLPFISYGGTAMIATLVGLGIVVNISRQVR